MDDEGEESFLNEEIDVRSFSNRVAAPGGDGDLWWLPYVVVVATALALLCCLACIKFCYGVPCFKGRVQLVKAPRTTPVRDAPQPVPAMDLNFIQLHRRMIPTEEESEA